MIPFLLASAVTAATPQAAPQTPKPAAAQTNTVAQPVLLLAQADSREAATQTAGSFPYASIKLGAGFPWDYNGNFDLLDEPFDTSIKLDGGFTGELAIGYQFNQVRAELAVGYGNYSANKQTFDSDLTGDFSVSSDGALNLTTVMVNGYYDIPITNADGTRSRLSPYVGAGIGYANINTPGCSGDGCFSGGSTGGFAYQGNIGLSYRVGDQSQAFLETGYLGATGGTIDDVDFGSFGSWRVFLGWRQGFGGAPKAKAVAVVEETPAPAPAANPSPEPTPEPQSMPIRGLW